MDATRFDALTRGLAAPASRRVAGRFLAGIGLAALLGNPADAAKDKTRKKGRKGKKRKGQKPKFNTFGCVDVGGFCKNGGQCCSGICSGKKNKKTCQGHNIAVGACEAGPLGFCAAPGGGLIIGTPCTSSADENGFCFTTTGNAPYCAVNSVQDAGCVACTKDKDCQRFCGSDAACIQCPACEAVFGVSTACAGTTDTCVFP
jgi:hypothetical protein